MDSLSTRNRNVPVLSEIEMSPSERNPSRGASAREAGRSFQDSNLESKGGVPRLILVAGGRLFDLGARLVELRLRQLDDRAQAEVVTLLRQIERVGRLHQELIGQRQTLERRESLQPCDPHVARDAVLQILKRLLFGGRPNSLPLAAPNTD